MTVFLEKTEYLYQTEKVIRLFLPFEKIIFNEEIENDRHLITEFSGNTITATLNFCGKTTTKQIEFCNEEKGLLKAVFLCFKEISKLDLEWGLLTGIRPERLFISLISQFGIDKATEIFKEDYLVKESKIELLEKTAKSEEKIIALSKKESVSLYISIPFCPSKCAYCSFVSDATKKAALLIPQYVEKLIIELKETAKYVNEFNLKLETVYIGGGTPSMLTAEQFTVLLEAVNEYFNLKDIREFTVEMGRPDTTTKEKLMAVKPYATRICINPQSLNNNVLKACGRNHTAEEFENAFNLARECGFNNINCDVIAGLPEDTPESFLASLKALIKLNPEGITVHTLSIKRAANFYKNAYYEFDKGKEVALMTNGALKLLEQNGYNPYYLYRQSKTAGNLENVGYSKEGYEGLYNVYIMDETHTILAVGAGAVTKLRKPFENKIERIFNYKFPFEYINDFNEMLIRKNQIGDFYNANCK